jgi:hypothetical protein
MFRWVRVREDDGPLFDAGHGFYYLLSKSPSLGANSDDGGRREILNNRDKGSRRRVRMGVRELEIERVGAAVEHHGGRNQVGDADVQAEPAPRKQDPLIAQFSACFHRSRIKGPRRIGFGFSPKTPS